MEKAASYRSAAEALTGLCAAHEEALNDTGLIEDLKDVIDRLQNEAFNAEVGEA